MSNVPAQLTKTEADLLAILKLMNEAGQDRLCSFARQMQKRFPTGPSLRLVVGGVARHGLMVGGAA